MSFFLLSETKCPSMRKLKFQDLDISVMRRRLVLDVAWYGRTIALMMNGEQKMQGKSGELMLSTLT
jgi:hypothetical protein